MMRLLVALFLAGCFSTTDDDPVDAGTIPPSSVLTHAGTSAPFPVPAPFTDAEPAFTDAGAPFAESAVSFTDGALPFADGGSDGGCGSCPPYETCIGGTCRSCTILADGFERSDSTEIGEADYPAGVFWEERPGPQNPADYRIVDGELRQGAPNVFWMSGTVSIEQGVVLDAAKLRYRTGPGWEGYIAVEINSDGLGTGLRIMGPDLCEAGQCDDGLRATVVPNDPHVEVVLSDGTLTATLAEGAYPRDGGEVIASATLPFGPQTKTGLFVWIGDTYSRLRELTVERFPCE